MGKWIFVDLIIYDEAMLSQGVLGGRVGDEGESELREVGQGHFQRTQYFRGAEVPTPQAFRGAQALGLNLQPPHPGGTYSYFHSLSLWGDSVGRYE